MIQHAFSKKKIRKGMSVIDVPDTSDFQLVSQRQQVDITRAGCVEYQPYMLVNVIDVVAQSV